MKLGKMDAAWIVPTFASGIAATLAAALLPRTGLSGAAAWVATFGVVVTACAATSLAMSFLWRGARRDVEEFYVCLRERRFDDLPGSAHPALGPVREELIALGAALRKREREVREREHVLSTLVEAVPMAIVLFAAGGQIRYANREARDLFFDGGEPEGGNFLNLLGRAPEALRRAIASEGDELFPIEDADHDRQTYHLAKRHVELDGEPAVLVVVKNMSREIHRQEIEVWKRLFRVLSHELNNSLAPILSLMHSGRALSRGSREEARLNDVFDVAGERAKHLASFLEGYSQFARLPAPRKSDVALGPFVAGLATLCPGVRADAASPGVAGGTGWFDPAQMQQVLINVIKNAVEASASPGDVELVVDADRGDALRIGVLDRGPGMSAEVMKNALVPFYSTKETGTGLGLPLSREIVEAHDGVLRLQTREGGGLEVWIRLPNRNASSIGAAKLTLTRA